ncbi:MAG: ABC transporter permease [Thermoguttaceae bacterium]|nr:ABC transporter permease [Thermoguttaceae bacterium]
MLIGPVFAREATIAPRRDKTYFGRGVYGGFLLLVITAAWLVTSGSQQITDIGDYARFGSSLFTLLAPLQLVVALFFGAMFAAAAVGQEKDRKTLVLLLMTRLSNSELVLGKLSAALLSLLVFLFVSAPIFLATTLLGGVSYAQVTRVLLVTIFATLASGSLGSCIALWRDKTFQALSATILTLALWLAFWEAVGRGAFGATWFGRSTETLAAIFSPWRAILAAARPDDFGVASSAWEWLTLALGPIKNFLMAYAAITVLVNWYAIIMCRVWNPSRETIKNATMEQDTWRQEAIQARLDREAAERRAQSTGVRDDVPYAELADNLFAVEETLQDVETREGVSGIAVAAREASARIHGETTGIGMSGATTQESIETGVAPEGKYAVDPSISSTGKAREVWDNPILWREMRTRAYGRKTFLVGLIYFVLFVLAAYSLHTTFATVATPTFAQLALPTLPLILLSMFLLNAQAIASMTSERDLGAFPLLLVSDLSPKEFVFGKLLGAFYNMKEAVIFPLALCCYLGWKGGVSPSTTWYLFFGIITLYFFVAMIGVHIGLQYENTRTAAGMSLGIVFFLFIGVAVCIWTMLAFSGSFEAQLQPFLAFMLGGGIGLYVSLGARNPSKAIALASFALPPATFYAATSFMLGKPFLVFVAVVAAYFFASLAMLIPAIDEFDVATGRATAD